MYTIYGVTADTITDIQNTFNHPIITNIDFIELDDLYAIDITDLAIIKINSHNITLDLGGVLYTINKDDYTQIIIA